MKTLDHYIVTAISMVLIFLSGVLVEAGLGWLKEFRMKHKNSLGDTLTMARSLVISLLAIALELALCVSIVLGEVSLIHAIAGFGMLRVAEYCYVKTKATETKKEEL